MSSDGAIRVAKGSFYDEDLCFFLQAVLPAVRWFLSWLKQGYGAISV